MRRVRQAHVILPPRSMAASNFPDWMATANEPRPLGWADRKDLARMFVTAGIAVVVGIGIAPYLWAALGALSEALS